MKVVVDANVVVSALVKPAITREVLLYPYVDYFSPSFLLEEIEEHEPEIKAKAGKNYREALDIITKNLVIVDYNSYKSKMKEAEKIIGSIDNDDVQYIALVLSLNADGIWSYDEDMKRQDSVEVFSTSNLLALIKSGII